MAQTDLTAADFALIQRLLPYVQRITEEGSEHGDLTTVEIEVVISGNALKFGWSESGDPALLDIWRPR